MAEPLFVGIDLGTARVKVGIFDPRGVQVALRIGAHDDSASRDWGAVTQDAAGWWRTTRRCLRAACATVDAARIAGVAVCGQGPTLVATDARLRPRGAALTWMDKRAEAEAATIAARLGRPIDAGHPIAKALRQALLEPDPRRRWYLQSWDFLTARLSGEAISSSLPFEQEIAAAGLPRAHFPPYVPAGSRAGRVGVAVAGATGLPAGIPVVAGTNDSIAACLGGGLTRKGRSLILGGTSGGFVLCWEPVHGGWRPPPGTYPEPEGLTYQGASISSSGLALDWLAGLFGRRDLDRWLLQASAIAPGAEGLVLLPYLAGLFLPYAVDARGPIDDRAARGVLLGLGAQHGVAHLIRAVLEGVAFAIRQVYERTVPAGAALDWTVTVGGQARSALWNGIKADVLGLQVATPAVIEAGALGAACLAAAGSGHYRDMWEASEAMFAVRELREPESAARGRYDALYRGVFDHLYPRVADLFPLLGAGEAGGRAGRTPAGGDRDTGTA